MGLRSSFYVNPNCVQNLQKQKLPIEHVDRPPSSVVKTTQTSESYQGEEEEVGVGWRAAKPRNMKKKPL